MRNTFNLLDNPITCYIISPSNCYLLSLVEETVMGLDHGLSSEYVKLIGHKCASPDCRFGYDIEGHHIFPLRRKRLNTHITTGAGEDCFWNLIALCRKCHGKFRNKNKEIELFTWKCMQELTLFGFVLDEREEDFGEKYKRLRANTRDKKEGYLQV